MVHHIIAKDTVDEAIMIAVKRKNKTQQSLLNAVRDYINRDTISIATPPKELEHAN